MARTSKHQRFRRFGFALSQLGLNKPRMPVPGNGGLGFGLPAQACRTAIKVRLPLGARVAARDSAGRLRSRLPSRRSIRQADTVPETRTGLNPVLYRQ